MDCGTLLRPRSHGRLLRPSLPPHANNLAANLAPEAALPAWVPRTEGAGDGGTQERGTEAVRDPTT